MYCFFRDWLLPGVLFFVDMRFIDLSFIGLDRNVRETFLWTCFLLICLL